MVSPDAKRSVVEHFRKFYDLSISSSCRLVGLHRSVYYYAKQPSQDAQIRQLIAGLIERHSSYGFWKLYYLLRHQGYSWNHKKVYRIYRDGGFTRRIKRKRRLPKREYRPLEQGSKPNECWSLDFLADRLQNGRRVRLPKCS